MSRLLYAIIALSFLGYVFGFPIRVFAMIGDLSIVPVMLIGFAVLSGFLTMILLRFLERQAIYDMPNERSMHRRPVPRGGGLVFVLLLAAGFFLLVFCGVDMEFLRGGLKAILGKTSYIPAVGVIRHTPFSFQYRGISPLTFALLAGFVLLAAVSWKDDRGGVSARLRLLAQFLAVGMVLSVYPVRSAFPFWLPDWVILPVVTFAWVWFINLYNFMDGIDGITAVETISISAVIAIMGLEIFADNIAANDLVMIICLVLFSASLGFLPYNWHPARIFLGDVGSVTVGYMLGFCLLHLAALGYWYIALTLPLYYLADSGITLATRLFYGQKIWQPHRSHFYQIAAFGLGRHDRVVYRIALCNLVLAGLSFGALFYTPWLCALSPIPVAILLRFMAKTGSAGYLGLGHG